MTASGDTARPYRMLLVSREDAGDASRLIRLRERGLRRGDSPDPGNDLAIGRSDPACGRVDVKIHMLAGGHLVARGGVDHAVVDMESLIVVGEQLRCNVEPLARGGRSKMAEVRFCREVTSGRGAVIRVDADVR